MNRKIKLATFALATVLFAGVLANASPVKAYAYEEFIVDLHNETFLKVESGDNFTVVLSTKNEVFTFGRNHLGQLGNGNTDTTLSVFNITESFNLNPGETIIDIDAGRDFTIALTSNNRIFTWGDNTYSQLGNETVGGTLGYSPVDVTAFVNPSNVAVSKIVAADENLLVWLANKQIIVSGSNNHGQMAQGDTTTYSDARIANFGGTLSVETIKDVGMFAATGYVLTESGKVFTWGDNGNKQVGNNGSTNVTLPAELTFPGLSVGEKVVSVSVGVNHGVAVTSAYKVFFWGTNSNYALGDSSTLALDAVKNTPFNATNALIYDDEGYLDGFVTETEDYGNDNVIDYEEVTRPLEVFAGNDATIFHAEYLYRYYTNGVPEPYEGPFYDYLVIGKNSFDGQEYLLTDYDDAFLVELEYAYWNTYNELDDIADFGFSRTNSLWLNEEGDFTIYGSNVYGQHGFGDTTFGGDYYNTNFSSNVRDFMGNIYDYLPTNLTAPLDDYFYPNDANSLTDELSDQYYAVFGYWNNNSRTPGLIDYFFPEVFNSQNEFTEREWSVFLPEEMLKMREIIATLFEDEILYESYISTDEKILDELNNNDREQADNIRYDMEFHSNYGGYDFIDWDEAFITDQAIIDLLPSAVETRLDRYRELLAQVETFEDTYLQPFLADMVLLTNDVTLDLDFTYYSEGYDENELDLGFDEIAYLIDNNYEEDILAIFEAYDALPELVQLLINEWNFYGIYEELYYAYYYYFADAYSDELYDFMDNIQDDDWYWYWPLFENLEDLEALLEKIDSLPSQSFTWLTETYTFDGEEYYDYDSYDYWIFLNDLMPYLKEAKPVFDQIATIDEFVVWDEDSGEYVTDLETVTLIFDMYADFLTLSDEAKELLDPDYVYELYELALQTLAFVVADQLYDLYEIEDNNGVYGLFENLDDVLAALAAFEALPEAALDYLEQEAIEYYDYLLSIKLALQEGLDVYEQIIEIEDLIQYDPDSDEEFVNLEDAQAILDMYADFVLLSDEAQELLNPDYVYYIYDLALQALANNVNDMVDELPDEETITIDDLQAVLDAIEAYENLPEDAKEYAVEAYQRLLGLLNAIRVVVEDSVDELPTLETFTELFNDPETREQAVNDLLAAKEAYDALTDDQKEDFDPELKAKLDALLSLYEELNRPDVDFGMIFLILVQLSAGAYFAFKKRDTLISVGNFKND